jgi:hypothetical protein
MDVRAGSSDLVERSLLRCSSAFDIFVVEGNSNSNSNSNG